MDNPHLYKGKLLSNKKDQNIVKCIHGRILKTSSQVKKTLYTVSPSIWNLSVLMILISFLLPR